MILIRFFQNMLEYHKIKKDREIYPFFGNDIELGTKLSLFMIRHVSFSCAYQHIKHILIFTK